MRKRPSLDFSVTGLVFCSMMMFMGLAAINSQANLLFGVFGLMIGILLISGVVSRLVLRKLELRRIVPDHAIAGRPMTVSYAIKNIKRWWPSLSLTVSELDASEAFTQQPTAYLMHAAPKTTAVVPVTLTPKRRGLHQLGKYQISSSFPFGFIKRAIVQRLEQPLLVFPPMGTVDGRLIALFRSATSTGINVKPRAGGQDEFFGTREYRSGDAPRMIHWKRSASAMTSGGGTLVAKEMTHISPPRLMVVVDNFRRDGSVGSAADAERVIAAAATLINEANRRELQAGVAAWEGPGKGVTIIPPSRGKRHRLEALTLLARLPLNDEANATLLLSAARNVRSQGITLVLITPDTAPARQDDPNAPVVVEASSDAFENGYIRFHEPIEFETLMPMDQETGQLSYESAVTRKESPA
ncbi:MAG: DUF58 domain-containing protein [Planctomycetota bacterium]